MPKFLLILFLFICTNQVFSQFPNQYIENRIRQTNSASAIWSFSVRDSSGSQIVDYHSDTFITPASNLKLLTSVAILDHLGPDYTYKTSIYGNGQLIDSTWDGDLFIIGSGDPSIGKEMYNDDPWYVFDHLIEQLKLFGINKITGQIIGDASAFDDVTYPKSWTWDDLSFYYAPELSALSFNRNCVDLVVNANGKVGSIPRIEWFPLNTNYVSFINEQQITGVNTEYDEYYHRVLGTNIIQLRSTLPKGYIEKESLSISDPPLFFIDTFVKYAERKGLTIDGIAGKSSFSVLENTNKLVELASHESKPVYNLLERVNKNSDNFYTEMLLKTIALEKTGVDASTETGLIYVRESLSELAIDTNAVHIVDGSGMGTSNLIATKTLSSILKKVQDKPWFQTFENSLSIAGLDGSFTYRFRGTPLKNNLKGKSGYMSGSRTISGYLTTSSGNRLSFSIATNHFLDKVKVIDSVHEDFLLWLYKNY